MTKMNLMTRDAATLDLHHKAFALDMFAGDFMEMVERTPTIDSPVIEWVRWVRETREIRVQFSQAYAEFKAALPEDESD